MKTLITHLKADCQGYAAVGNWYAQPGYWIVAVHRFGEAALRAPIGLRQVMWLIYRVLHLSYHFFNIELWAGKQGATLGPGICLLHPNNLYFGPHVTLGANCLVHHEVTLGMGSVPGTPQLGNNVVLYPGARLQGGIVVGDDAVIGANCVVSRHIAPGSVVLPGPNRILPRALSPMAKKLDNAKQVSSNASHAP